MPIVTSENKIYQVQPPISLEQLMERVCNHWVQKILFALDEADDYAMTYGAINKKVQPTSEKMFADALIELDAYGLILKKADRSKTGQAIINYSLTERGKSLLSVVIQLRDWTTDNLNSIAEHAVEWNNERVEIASLGK
ncbi:MAG: helix-turn-helix transcriptional regulator [Bacteroidales bacterium]|nr:helix-turn-helix transcriptional regulator [Bacteroidales bacterium]